MKKKNTKLIPLIGILLVAGFLATSLASYFASKKSLRLEISRNQLPLTGDNIYSEIQRDLIRPIFISSLMASDTFLRDWIIQGEENEEKIVRYLKEIKDKYHTITSFFVSDATHNYYYAGGILKKISPDEERDRWYYRVEQMEDEYEINIDPDMANSDEMTIFVNYRVHDYEGKYIGATGVGLTVSAVKKLISKYQEKYGRKIFFIDYLGNIKLADKNFSDSVKNIYSDDILKIYREKLTGADEVSFSYISGKDTVLANARYIKEFGWTLIVEQAEGKALKPIFRTFLINLLICFGITALVLLLVVLIIKAYQKKIDTLRGIVPICSYCKQIRDDKGYWNQVDEYVARHTEAEFSHSICPECVKKYFPDLPSSKS